MGICAAAGHVLNHLEPLFVPERIDICADLGLLNAMVARGAAALRRFCALGGGQKPGLNPERADAYGGAGAAMLLLSRPALCQITLLFADGQADEPHGCLFDDITTATEHFLRIEPPPEMGPARCSALANALYMLHWRVQPPPFMPVLRRAATFKDALRCAVLGAAAGIQLARLLQAGDTASPDLARGFLHLSILLEAVKRTCLLPDYSVDYSVPPGTDAGSWAAQHHALETMLRLAAVLPASLPVPPGAPPDMATNLPPVITMELCWLFEGVHLHVKPMEPPDEAEAWRAYAGLVASAAKFSLRLAGLDATSAPLPSLQCLNSMVQRAAACFYRRLEGREEAESFPTRQVVLCNTRQIGVMGSLMGAA